MKRWIDILLIIACIHSSILSGAMVEKDTVISDTRHYYIIPKVSEKITVDGRMTESFWAEAANIPANIEVSPAENVPAPVQTLAHLAYTDAFLYVAIEAFDPAPNEIQAHFRDRDHLDDEDWILILFDTFNDQRRTYDFMCNPLGIQSDFIETPHGGGGEWDAIWESHGRITDNGYIVEMAIPFSSIEFPRTAGDQEWGFDVVRSYPRNVRHHIGAFPRDRNNNCYMCQSHKLIGFAGATPGNNVELDPTLSGIWSQERQDETSGPFVNTNKKADPGLTAHWGITPNMIFSGTVNPDFSNIEADALQLDINNQFAIYYDEKRPFFLKGADFFSTRLQTVHTRTLADPDWGIKLTGKEGGHTIGFFTARDQWTNILFPGPESSDSESLEQSALGSVFRYKYDVSKSSNMGGLVTLRKSDGYENRLASADGDLKLTSTDRLIFQLAGSQTIYPDTLVSAFTQPAGRFNGHAMDLYYEHDTRSYNLYGLYRDIGRNFRTDMGFMPQSGYKYSELGGTWKWRADGNHWYNWLSIYGSWDFRRTRDNKLMHRAYTMRLNYEGPMRSHGHIYTEIGRDRYEGQEFRTNWIQGCAGLYPAAPMLIHIYWRYGDRIDYTNTQAGTSTHLNPSMTWNAGLHVRMELDHVYEHLDVEGGRLYTANISRLKLMYQFSKQIMLRGIIPVSYTHLRAHET